MDKKQPNKSGRLSAAEQQQLALLQQLGTFDPNMLGYGMPGCFDPTQLLNPLVNAQYPMMNPAALPAFSGLGRRSNPSTSGGADWLAMMQNQALAAGLGAGYLPGIFPGYLPPTEISKQGQKALTSSALKARDDSKRTHDRMSPRSDSRSPSVSRIQQERKSSHESHSSKDRPESRHSMNSPHRSSNTKHHDSKPAIPSWMNNNRKMNEQAFQMEILRQFEQQILLQQLQMQQQQHFNAAFESIMSLQEKPNMPSRKDGEAQKAQEQLNAMMAQLMQPGGMHNMSPAMSALLAQPGALETVLAMSQMGGSINSLPGVSDKPTQEKEPNRDQPSTSSSQHNSGLSASGSHTSHRHSSPVTSSIMKMHEHSTSPRTSQHGDRAPKLQGVSIPGLSPTLTAGLSPDNAVLALMYSQQLQYEEYIKKQFAATSKRNDPVESKAGDHEVAHSSKTHFFNESSPRYNQSAHLHNAVTTPLSKDKSTDSPRRKMSSSPPRKGREQDGDIHKASNSHTFKQPTSSKLYEQESMSETLKLLSTLASNPNLTQQEVAALLSIPPNVDPSTLLATLSPAASALVQPSLNKRQVTSADLENLNKNLADALDAEKRKFQDQMKAHIEREMGKSVNHISVIHKNKFKTPNRSEEPSAPNTSENVCNLKSGSDGITDILRYSTQGDAISSDGDVKSEMNATDKQTGSAHGRSTRPRIPISDEVMAPLKHGWKREIRFKPFGGQLRGEVVYTTPDKRKLRMYADVMKYLDDNNIKDLNRSNFSFSTRLRLGTLLERKDGKDGNREWVEISDDDLEQQSHLNERVATSSPFADGSDRMSTYSSSSKGDSKHNNKDKEQDREKQKEQLRMLKEQEELRLEQQHMEREIRERLALEEIERQRIAEDQRRQQMLLMRALESRKRAEERERRREELRIEKMLQREKKMEQRRIAMQIARELKMPVEDMAAIGAPELPSLTRLQGTYDNKCPHQLSGNACADLLMVLEFVKTFKECLRIDDGAILTFEQLQLGVLSDPKHTLDLVRLTIALLHQCLCDPGVPAPGPWLHCLTGVKVTDIDVSEDNYSEILRLFIWARSGFKTEIAVKLETLSFLSLSADEKATSLAFLVNELVCSRPICMEIEKNLDTIATLKRDKWIVEGQMRQLRIAYEKNPAMDGSTVEEDSSSAVSVKSATQGEEMGSLTEENAEAVFQKKMEELTQQHNSYNTQLVSNAKPLRALDLGQDRFKRRYWVLPNLGGVYVEGLESGISYEDDDESPDEDENEDEDDGEDQLEDGCTGNDSDSGEYADEKKEDGKADYDIPLQKSEAMDVDNSISRTSDDFMHDTKSLDDPTASSKDIANVLMMLSQEPVNHEINKSKLTSFEKSSEVLSGNGANNSDDTAKENLAAVDTNPSQDALDAVTALNTMKANCETKADTSGVSNPCNSFTECLDRKSSEAKQNSSERSNSACDKDGSENEHDSEDRVVAAAKAIAAKAVASTSHLLFPKTESPPKLKPKKEVSLEKYDDQKPHDTNAGDNSTLPIGEHTINALVQMGLNPASLSSQQLEALSHLNIPMPPPNNGSVEDKSITVSNIKPDLKTHQLEVDCEVPKKSETKHNSENQDSPVDLSKIPSTNTDTNSISVNTDGKVKPLPVKTESLVNTGSPFTLQESPDPKSSDNKFFIPISFANGSKNNSSVKSEQEQYNQMVYSCPSPSILANYIISSANYGQLPPLDDIKFPIRPPDVKEEPDAIPRERKRGWWRIESESELRNLSEKLHLRGIREKQLHKNITKNFEFCTNSMVESLKPEHRFITLTKDAIPNDSCLSKEKTAPEKTKKSSRVASAHGENTENISCRFFNSDSSAFKAEIAVLKQVEELAARCLDMGIVSTQWQTEHAKPSATRKDLRHVPLASLRDQLGIEIKFDVLNPIQHDPESALGVAVDLLASLEHAVCRRYLKPPLVRKGGASEFSSLPSLSESGALDVAAGLRTWRNAVVSSASAAQVALCVRMLDSCIAWDRSAAHQAPSNDDPINNSIKNKKRKSDKKSAPKNSPAPESPHPPKKKRKKKAVPIKITVSPLKTKKARRMPIDTADVISKSQAPEVPYTNGDVELDNHEADISNTDTFEASYNSATDESSGMHVNHVSNDVKNGSDSNTIGSPTFSHPNSDNMSDEYRPNSEPKKKKKKKKYKPDDLDGSAMKKNCKPRKRADKEVVVCRGVLQELQSHEDATWFLFPVDCKLVPGYRKIIKKPIDFHTIESRLKRGRYKNKEEFVSEVRLVFDNCQKFNEDDSNIGRAGHNIRAFFEKRWLEVLRENFGVVNTPEEKPANISAMVMIDTNHHCLNENEVLDQDSSLQSLPDQSIPNALVMDLDET